MKKLYLIGILIITALAGQLINKAMTPQSIGELKAAHADQWMADRAACFASLQGGEYKAYYDRLDMAGVEKGTPRPVNLSEICTSDANENLFGRHG